LERFGCPAISLSEPFEDGLALLRVADQDDGLARGQPGTVWRLRLRKICGDSGGHRTAQPARSPPTSAGKGTSPWTHKSVGHTQRQERTLRPELPAVPT